MGQEVTAFIILGTATLLIFIIGILLFIIQHRRRKVQHEHEKNIMNEVHNRELLTTQLQIQEQTMADIGREIHDNVGQRLTLASIYANQLLAAEGEADERLQSIGSIINDSLSELRALSKSLVSADADSAELAAILLRECARVRALNICAVSCTVTEARFTIAATVKNFIIRIVQEALQNSLKHAGCSLILLRLDYEEGGLNLQIEDDGAGFDMAAEAAGIGLKNMRKRAELIGASLVMHSEKGKGTRMQLSIPSEKLTTD